MVLVVLVIPRFVFKAVTWAEEPWKITAEAYLILFSAVRCSLRW